MARHDGRSYAHFSRLMAILACAACAVATAGCNDAQSRASTPPPTASQVLERMVDAYRGATSYADSGQIRLSYRRPGSEPNNQAVDCSVAFVRPNKLRMHCYQGIVVCDGRQLRATVADLPGQVLDAQAPDKLRREDLYNDEILAGVLTQGLAGESIQLALLLLDDPLKPVLQDGAEPALLAPQPIDGDACHRVEVKRPDGLVILWIDQKTYVLRRLEYPSDELRKQIAQHEQAAVTDVSLVADLKGARLNEPIADVAFRFDLPADAKLVKRFQYQPEPLPKLLGQKLNDFAFTGLDGKAVDGKSLSGKIVVLDFWATWCGWCFKGLPNLETVYGKFKDHDQVAILAVSTDEASVSDDDLRAAFTKAGLSIPIVRDAQQQSRSIFEVQGLPTMVILGADGTVQAIEVGFQPQLAVDLPRKIERLLAGENLYDQALREQQARLKSFEESLAAGGEQVAADGDIPRALLAPASPPESLRLRRIWTSSEVTKAGNILVVEDAADSPRLLVNDGWRTVVALDARGQLAERYQLDIADDSAVSYLRTATDAQGRRYYAGSASAQGQCIVFDQEFRRVLSYPNKEHTGISDVRLADLDGDGQPELAIGYWGVGGVQSVTLEGRPRWEDKTLENVFCLAVTPTAGAGPRTLLAADGRGAVVPIDDAGRDGRPIQVAGRFIRWLLATDLDGDGSPEICAIASIRAGVESMIGLSPEGAVLWTYDLPAGAQPNAALEMLAAGPLVGSESQWIVAASDGSVHIVSAKGERIDRFACGAAIGGIAVARIGGVGTLVVATDQGVDAWQVEQSSAAE